MSPQETFKKRYEEYKVELEKHYPKSDRAKHGAHYGYCEVCGYGLQWVSTERDWCIARCKFKFLKEHNSGKPAPIEPTIEE